MNKVSIPVYIINLKNRIDRRQWILAQFCQKKEFDIHLVAACEHRVGAIGLWNSIKYILQNMISEKDEFILICEDDHQFTDEYSKERLFTYIEEAKEKEADILLGGISWLSSSVQVSKNFFWVEKFSGLQFTFIFKKFFKAILSADFEAGDAADYKISSLTNNKFFIYPFISIQKDCGYSDVTPKNNVKGRIEEIFNQSRKKLEIFKTVSIFYERLKPEKNNKVNNSIWKNVVIPTYIINLPERVERKVHIERQFQGKSEFDIRIIEACKHKIGAMGLWLSIRMAIELAIKNDDDVIVICEDDHEFTSQYDHSFFIHHILLAYQMNCNILSGGIGGFNMAIPLSQNLYWIDSFWCTQFMVIFRKFFKPILNESFTDHDTADGKFSEMTSHKMVLYPFISVQKDFGYSDVTYRNNAAKYIMHNYFKESSSRLSVIQKVSSKYKYEDSRF